jgi:hypothetical protein
MGALETGILEQNDRTMSVLSVTLVQRADTRRSELCSSAPAAACNLLLVSSFPNLGKLFLTLLISFSAVIITVLILLTLASFRKFLIPFLSFLTKNTNWGFQVSPGALLENS